MSNQVAIVGGHGQVARHLHPLLVAAGRQPVALVRSDDQRAELEEAGAHVRLLNIEQSNGEAFGQAFQGCDSVVFAAGGGPDGNIERKRTVDLEGALKSIEGARAAGITRFVMVSAIGVDEPLPDDTAPVWKAYVEAKRDADEALRLSGLDWTILRPGRLTDDPAPVSSRSVRTSNAARSRARTSPPPSPPSSTTTGPSASSGTSSAARSRSLTRFRRLSTTARPALPGWIRRPYVARCPRELSGQSGRMPLGTVLSVRPCTEGLPRMRLPVRRRTAASWVAATSVIALAVAGVTLSGSTASAADSDQVIQGLSSVPNTVTLDNQVDADKASSSALAKTSPGLLKITSPKRIPVMIKYDYDAVASYRGTVSGYAATSPSVTDQKLTSKQVREVDYLGYVKRRTHHHPRGQVGGPRRVRDRELPRRCTAAWPPPCRATASQDPADARRRRGPARRAQPAADRRQPAFINATAAYNALGTTRNAGKGIMLGNLDSGVWPEHPAFADQGNLPADPARRSRCNFGDNPLTPAADPFVCNKKLVGGRAFLGDLRRQRRAG